MGCEKSGTQHRQRSRKQVAKARKEWVSGREVESVTVDQAVIDLRSVKPKWEGLQSFDRVWDDAVATGIAEDGIIGGIPVVSRPLTSNATPVKTKVAALTTRIALSGEDTPVTSPKAATLKLI